MSDSVVLTHEGSALWARINRPRAGNSCSSEVMAALEGWLDRANDPGVRVLVVTGTDTSFCAGADLKEGTALLDDPPALRAFLDRGRNLVRRLRRAPVPTIAAVNGAAFGGGLELMLGCDIAVAAASARIGDGHIGVGQVPGWGSSAMLPLAVGPALARRLLLTGESWSAEVAVGHGLVTDVVADELLHGRVAELAGRLAQQDRDTVTRMLTVARSATEPAEAAWIREWDNLLEHVASQRIERKTP